MTKNNFTILLKVFLGLIFLILGALAALQWWESVLTVFKGCIVLFLFLAGIITLAVAKE